VLGEGDLSYGFGVLDLSYEEEKRVVYGGSNVYEVQIRIRVQPKHRCQNNEGRVTMPFVGEIGIITKYILTALEQIKKISKPKELSTCVSRVYDFFSFLKGS